MRIIVTGSRHWDDRRAIAEGMANFYRSRIPEIAHGPVPVVVHGCAAGADALADDIAQGWGWEVERHYAKWEVWGKGAGPLRNQEMCDLGADVCLAFPLGRSNGTHDCMRRAARAGIVVIDLGRP